MSEVLWQPDDRRIEQSAMFRFLQAVNAEFSLDLKTYPQLHRWSVEHAEDFWDCFVRHTNIRFRKPANQILSGKTMPGARWFVGAELNYAENLLLSPPDKCALISKIEGKPPSRLTYGQLSCAVERFAAALTQAGVQPGDRVAGFMPNIPETVIAMLGASALGAVWSSCSPDFGPQGVKERFGQIEPKILICVTGYTYNGKYYSILDTISTLVREVRSLTHVVVVPFPDESASKEKMPFPAVYSWEEFTGTANNRTVEFRSLPFDHPLAILYSSGTTGLPKCIVHGAGGTLLQHFKEHALHTDIGPGDTVFYYTTCGWMMWNWLISALARQATLVLYEGSPSYPNLETLWRLIEETGITVFGTSPKFLSSNQKQGLLPANIADLQSLKTMLSTGSPLEEETFRWVYQNVKSDIQLSSISGGTDIISCFMLGNPLLPVRAGEIQCLGLGMDVVSLDANNQPVLDQKGELACRSPAPSMPIAFWNDADGKKYEQAYFDQIPGVWVHGDFIEIKSHGGVIVYGRSDATLNPGGVRIGTAEIYRIVEQLPEIRDSLIIGVEGAGDIQMILFVVLAEPAKLDETLVSRIKTGLRREATPRHVPQELFQVQDVPRTLNGKKVELTVLNIFSGRPVINKDALANPDCLKEYEDIHSRRRAANAAKKVS